MKIFKAARLKLTAYYITILMVVLFLFSGILYQIGVNEIRRSYAMAIVRNRTVEFSEELRGNPIRRIDLEEFKLTPTEEGEYLEDVSLARRFLFHNILMANLGILFISSLLSYFLAGKTLGPIEEMVEKQRTFISDASHELRTPITAIQTSLEVALRDKKMKKTEAVDILEENLDDIKGLRNLSEELLTLASYEESYQTLNREKIELPILADDILDDFRLRAREKKIKLEQQVDNVIVCVDQEKIKQLVAILVDNALKYSPSKTKIKLSMKLNKNEFVIKVKDQGMGIAAEDIPHVFDRFYKSDKARQKDATSSFGLGLAIAKKIAESHKAQLAVESKVDKGTTFTIKLMV